jgi:cytochrome c-type biogenesis protein CcmH/NrfF
MDWQNNQVGCQMYFYIILLSPFLTTIMLVLSSFDRYCSSSKSRRLHSTSSIRTARLTIVIATVLCAIYLSPTLFSYHLNPTTKTCQSYYNQAVNIYLFSQAFLFDILAPLLMIIFGFLTVYNIRQHAVHVRVQGVSAHGRRTEGQLARMLILQISVHLVLTVPFGVTYSMNAFDPSTQTPNIIAVRSILVVWQQCDYFISFFLYVLSGQVYRQQLIRILKCIKCQNRQIHPHTHPQNGLIHNLRILDNIMPAPVEISTAIH